VCRRSQENEVRERPCNKPLGSERSHRVCDALLCKTSLRRANSHNPRVLTDISMQDKHTVWRQTDLQEHRLKSDVDTQRSHRNRRKTRRYQPNNGDPGHSTQHHGRERKRNRARNRHDPLQILRCSNATDRNSLPQLRSTKNRINSRAQRQPFFHFHACKTLNLLRLIRRNKAVNRFLKQFGISP